MCVVWCLFVVCCRVRCALCLFACLSVDSFVCCVLRVVCGMFVVCCLLFVVSCLLIIVRWPLLVV